MENFSERLSTLPDLSDEELDALEVEMVAAFDAADEAGDVDTMQALADGLDEVRAEKTRRTETAPAEAPAAAPAEVAASATSTTSATDATVTPLAATGLGAESPENQIGTPPGEAPAPAPQAEQQPAPEPPAEPQPEPQPEPPAEPAPEPAPAPEEPPAEPAPEPEPAPAEPASEPAPEEQPAEPAPEGEPAPEEEQPPAEGEPAPETASATTEQENNSVDIEVTASDVPEENDPVAAPAERPNVILAGGDIPGYTAGSELTDMEQVAEAFAAKVNSIRGIAGDGEHILVASIRNREHATEDQTLSSSDPIGNQRKVRQLVGDPANLTRDALVAAGWCAPKVPIYDIPSIGTTDRPIGSSLPTFNADRGGIIFTRPPTIVRPTAVDPRGVSVWTPGDNAGGVATDQAAITTPAMALTPVTGGAAELALDPLLKPFFDVVCGVTGEAELVALTLGLCFSNLHQRAYPEWIRVNTDFALVQQARMAEEWVLGIMKGASTPVGGAPATVLGTARDTLLAVRIAAQEFRWNNRLAQTTPLTFVAPSWVRDAMAADLTFQAPGDDALNTSFTEVDSWFGDFNVDAVWSNDGLTPAWTDKGAYPATFDYILYATGAFLRLDGGTLDLGVVRTKEDIQTNRYCTFTESFEAVAYIGPGTGAADGKWSYTDSLAIKTKGGVGGAVTIA
jgi:hypothetical protein